MDLRLLKQQAQNLTPILRIGKNGLTEAVLSEVTTHLKKRGLIKIKMLRSALEKTSKKELARTLAAAVDAQLVDVTGLVVVLYKQPHTKH
ncbi:YhbY family RNA-binding protein [Candidatus Woesearchaeota archaeon]|nr:YhbY family RNA-binding protein [Candidatus Woesearchaeota archaeon]